MGNRLASIRKLIYVLLFKNFCIGTALFVLLTGFRFDSTDELTSQLDVSSWYDPTPNDFRKLQDYIENFYRKNSKDLFSIYKKKRFDLLNNFKFCSFDGVNPTEDYQTICFNEDINNKENCIICYISCSKGYYLKLIRLIHFLEKFNFKGHFIYRIGRWPDVKSGSLFYFNTPYAFKPFFFNEVRNLGYKKVLWLDASICLNKPIDPVFDWISENGFVLWSDYQKFHQTVTSYVEHALELTRREVYSTKRYAAGIIGLNFNNPLSNNFLDQWIDTAKNRQPFLSQYPEETVMSILLHRLDVKNCDFTKELLRSDDCILYVNREVPIDLPEYLSNQKQRINYEEKPVVQ